MRLILMLFIVLAAGAARAATFQTRPSARLLDSEALELYGIRQPVAPEADLSAPPLVGAPGGALKARDPWAGGISGNEVTSGALMILGADVLSIGVGIAVGSYAAANNPRSGDLFLGPGVAAGLMAGAIADLLFVPLASALGVQWSGNDEAGGGFGGAYLGAWGGELLAVGTLVALNAVSISASSSSSSSAGGSVAGLAMMLFLGLHYVGTPMLSSWGHHWSTQVDDRRPERIVVRPSDQPAAITAPAVKVLALSY
jgi:hypothetical protein